MSPVQARLAYALSESFAASNITERAAAAHWIAARCREAGLEVELQPLPAVGAAAGAATSATAAADAPRWNVVCMLPAAGTARGREALLVSSRYPLSSSGARCRVPAPAAAETSNVVPAATRAGEVSVDAAFVEASCATPSGAFLLLALARTLAKEAQWRSRDIIMLFAGGGEGTTTAATATSLAAERSGASSALRPWDDYTAFADAYFGVAQASAAAAAAASSGALPFPWRLTARPAAPVVLSSDACLGDASPAVLARTSGPIRAAWSLVMPPHAGALATATVLIHGHNARTAELDLYTTTSHAVRLPRVEALPPAPTHGALVALHDTMDGGAVDTSRVLDALSAAVVTGIRDARRAASAAATASDRTIAAVDQQLAPLLASLFGRRIYITPAAVARYVASAGHFIESAWYLLAAPTGPHAAFLDQHVQAVTVQAMPAPLAAGDGPARVGPTPASELGLQAVGSGLEKSLQALCGIDERLHASTAQYVLLGADTFVGFQEYSLAGGVLHLPVLILAITAVPSKRQLAGDLASTAATAAAFLAALWATGSVLPTQLAVLGAAATKLVASLPPNSLTPLTVAFVRAWGPAALQWLASMCCAIAIGSSVRRVTVTSLQALQDPRPAAAASSRQHADAAASATDLSVVSATVVPVLAWSFLQFVLLYAHSPLFLVGAFVGMPLVIAAASGERPQAPLLPAAKPPRQCTWMSALLRVPLAFCALVLAWWLWAALPAGFASATGALWGALLVAAAVLRS